MGEPIGGAPVSLAGGTLVGSLPANTVTVAAGPVTTLSAQPVVHQAAPLVPHHQVTTAPPPAPAVAAAPAPPVVAKKGKVKKNKKYGCDKCEYRTSQRQSLVQHDLAVHEKVKPYPCPYEGCEYRCARKQNMDKHVMGVHQKLRPFRCTICSKVQYFLAVFCFYKCIIK